MNQTGAIYNDFTGLANLKAEAAKQSPEATREAARQFEALFVQMMLKSMRSAGAVLGEERDTTYEEMFDQQVSMEMTRDRGIGIAEMLVRQLGSEAPDEDAGLRSLDLAADRFTGPTIEAVPQRADWRPAGRQEFIQDIWPLAERAAADLDIDPRTLVAQAALETGWGQRLIRDGTGISGNNLFGIKADSRWDGERVTVNTLEYDKGQPTRVRDEFRAYPGLREGFEDYVNFLKGNARYDSVTRGGLTPEEYAGSLQDAGYATDPDYAEKIKGIVNSSRLNDLVGQLKFTLDKSIYL
jgi:flagellar protein FlgJ